MPGSKISVAHLLDHGPLAASVAAMPLAEASEPELAPADSDAAVMRIAKNISVADRVNPQLARVVVAAKNPEQLATALIEARHDKLGGARGVLGAATTPVRPCPDKRGFFQHFKKGSIYWSPTTGAHEVLGAIRQKWSAMGWERSSLGYPRTGERKGGDTKEEGRCNHFQGGSIYWHPATGAHEVHGAIRAKYLELGAEASVLGYPSTDETGTPDRLGRFNHFQAGSIYWTARTGAHEVHGLIRQFWAQHGWERNPRLGYPVTDELIPHRGIGHTRPASLRKPVANLPLDVVRLPDEQPSPTFEARALTALGRASAARADTDTAAVANVRPVAAAAVAAQPATSPAARRPTARAGTAAAAPALVARPATAVVATPGLVRIPPIVVNPVASHKGQSQDRYSDFEDGVVFWPRGRPAAQELAPRAKAPNGDRMAWTGAEIAALATTPIRQAIGTIPGGHVTGTAFVGTTGYSWDGSGIRNRAHRIRVILQGMRQVGPVPVPSIATVEVRFEVGFDPVDREIVGYLTSWSLTASQGDFLGGGSLERTLHQRLDPALWRQHLVTRVPATADDPIAVLSVKTQADGDVVVYFEP